MATFYLLPPRPFLGECFSDYLKTTFPGLEVVNRMEVIELFCQAVSMQPDVYVVHREDLPKGEGIVDAIVHGYGAEPGDEIVEVHSGKKSGEIIAVRQCVSAAA